VKPNQMIVVKEGAGIVRFVTFDRSKQIAQPKPATPATPSKPGNSVK